MKTLQHLTHLEDSILNNDDFITLFTSYFEKNSTIKITQKIDGAPSVVCASDYYGKKFIGLKSWNNGNIYKSDIEIKERFKDNKDLLSKILTLFNLLPDIQIPKNEIWQGDFLYIKQDLIISNETVSFKPNTILYQFNKNSEEGKAILNSELGIAWHTRYIGENKDINFSAPLNNLNKTSKVFYLNVELKNNNLDCLKENLLELKTLSNELFKNENYYIMSNDNHLIEYLNKFRNKKIKENVQRLDVKEFNDWLKSLGQEEELLRKTTKGKEKIKEQFLGYSWLCNNTSIISDTYNLQNNIIDFKNKILENLNKNNTFKTFIETEPKKYNQVNNEGYVISDDKGTAFKIVDRLEFSKNNFSDKIIKGWTKKHNMFFKTN